MNNNWLDIETAPKDETGFIYYQKLSNDLKWIGSAHFDVTKNSFVATNFFGDDHIINPSHWQPLPEFPV